MEPNQTPQMPPVAQVTPTQPPQNIPPTPVAAAPQEPSLVEHHHVSAIAIFCSSIILFFAAMTVYLYMTNSQYKMQLGQVSAQVSQLQAQLQGVMQRDVTITGPVMNSVYKFNDTSFIFLDNNGGAWVVNHTEAQFAEFSATAGKANGTDGKMPATLSDWLTTEHSIGQAQSISGAPGIITIKGIFRNDGVLHATEIRVDGQ